MAKRKKCTVSIDPTREATPWDSDREVIPGTRYPGFPGLVYDWERQGPIQKISCYQDFLRKKREAKRTGVLRAYLSCPVGAPWRIESYGDYAFSTEVANFGTWDSNWGDGRIAVRFRMGKEVWAGMVFLGMSYTHCEPEPNGPHECQRWDPETQRFRFVRGRKSKDYNSGNCPGDSGLYGIFRRTNLLDLDEWRGRNYPREYKLRSKEQVKAHWAATAERRKEERAEERARKRWAWLTRGRHVP